MHCNAKKTVGCNLLVKININQIISTAYIFFIQKNLLDPWRQNVASKVYIYTMYDGHEHTTTVQYTRGSSL